MKARQIHFRVDPFAILMHFHVHMRACRQSCLAHIRNDEPGCDLVADSHMHVAQMGVQSGPASAMINPDDMSPSWRTLIIVADVKDVAGCGGIHG